MYDIGPLVAILGYFVLIGTVISFVYYIIKRSKLSKRIFLSFSSIIVATIVILFIIFVLLMIEILWCYLLSFRSPTPLIKRRSQKWLLLYFLIGTTCNYSVCSVNKGMSNSPSIVPLLINEAIVTFSPSIRMNKILSNRQPSALYV